MQNLDKIIEKIKSEAAEKAEAVLREAQEKCDEVIRDARERAATAGDGAAARAKRKSLFRGGNEAPRNNARRPGGYDKPRIFRGGALSL